MQLGPAQQLGHAMKLEWESVEERGKAIWETAKGFVTGAGLDDAALEDVASWYPLNVWLLGQAMESNMMLSHWSIAVAPPLPQ